MTYRRTPALLAGLALTIVAAACVPAMAADPEGWPPPPPQNDRKLSTDLDDWKYSLFDDLLIDDERVERAIGYVVDLPGDPKLRMYELEGDEKPTAHDIKDFYLGWAAENGYRMLVESWNSERDGVTGLLHKPGEDGGIFIYQCEGDEVLWLWDEGHPPIGPLFAAWFDFPKVKATDDAPDGPRPWRTRNDLPQIYKENMSLRVELDRWEIESIATDLEHAAEVADEHKSLHHLLVAAPELLETVRHVWFLSYEAGSEEALREEVAPWVDWAERNELRSVAEGEMNGIKFEFFIRSGADGGLLLVMEEGTDVDLLVFDGGPHMEAVSDILDVAIKASQAEE
jgi:hypothetical protein